MSNGTNETHSQLIFERTSYTLIQLGSMSYGAHLMIFFTSVCYILQEGKIPWRSLLFISALMALATIEIACNLHFDELAWVEEHNFPGGTGAFLNKEEFHPVNTIGNSAGIVAAFLSEGLLLSRAFMIWDNNRAAMFFPLLVYIGSTVSGVLVVYNASRPILARGAIKYCISYWSLNMSLNIMLTVMIVTRLLWMRKRIRATLGRRYGQTYTGIAAMIIESALPYGIISLVFIVLYATKPIFGIVFLPPLTQAMCIAPNLIIIRVTRGEGWTSDTVKNSSIPGPQKALHLSESSGSSRSSSAGVEIKVSQTVLSGEV